MADTITTLDPPAIEIALRTDPGRDPDKQVNEDACGHRVTRFGHLAVVCDGMGGHLGGKEASEKALATIFRTFDEAPDAASGRDVLARAIERANEAVFQMAPLGANASRPGSTVVAILVQPSGCEIAHVGDSRCYVVHAGKAEQLTRDHSVVQQMVAAGLLSPEAAKSHPDANRITRALGTAHEIDVELAPSPYPFVTGDVFVLCSDGLSDLVEPAEILEIAGSEPPAQAAGRLVDLANARGGHDNITVIVARMKASAAQPASFAVAPTVVQTVVEAPAAVHVPPAPKKATPRSPRWTRGVALVLACVALGAAIVVLAVGLRPERRSHTGGGWQQGREGREPTTERDGAPVERTPIGKTPVENPPVENRPLENPPVENPPVENPALPKLHHPDGSLLP
jgi:protein phosphatase